jgi:hypothetical protein
VHVVSGVVGQEWREFAWQMWPTPCIYIAYLSNGKGSRERQENNVAKVFSPREKCKASLLLGEVCVCVFLCCERQVRLRECPEVEEEALRDAAPTMMPLPWPVA